MGELDLPASLLRLARLARLDRLAGMAGFELFDDSPLVVRGVLGRRGERVGAVRVEHGSRGGSLLEVVVLAPGKPQRPTATFDVARELEPRRIAVSAARSGPQRDLLGALVEILVAEVRSASKVLSFIVLHPSIYVHAVAATSYGILVVFWLSSMW